jgi:putative redox protein
MTLTDTSSRPDVRADPTSFDPAERAERLTAAGTAWAERIAADANSARLTYKVSGTSAGSVATRIKAGKHRFLVDEPAALAGGGA